MIDITPGAEVNVELTSAAEITAELGGRAEIAVELTPGAEVNVELTPAAEIAVELGEGPTVEVELAGGAELHFLPDGALEGYYDKEETDALLSRKAEAAALAGKADRTELEQKADADHDHDGRYYTEAETDALLALKVARAALLDLVYPVGAIYMSVNAASPATLFGGTWERITGRFLLAATDGGSSGASQAAGRTGGEATHTLTANQIPAHTHGSKTLTGYAHSRRYGGTSQYDIIGVNGTSGIVSVSGVTWSGSHGQLSSGSTTVSGPTVDRLTVNATHEHNSVGGGQAHNNMPPYLAVYVWKRTA